MEQVDGTDVRVRERWHKEQWRLGSMRPLKRRRHILGKEVSDFSEKEGRQGAEVTFNAKK